MGEFFERIKHAFGDALDRKSPDRHTVSEAVILLSTQKEQIASHSYRVDDKTTIDLGDWQIGTIFRLQTKLGRFHWCVLGAQDKNKRNVYWIYKGAYIPPGERSLRIGQDWDMTKVRVKKTTFLVNEVKKGLGWTTPQQDTNPAITIDVMFGGKTEVERPKTRIFSPQTVSVEA